MQRRSARIAAGAILLAGMFATAAAPSPTAAEPYEWKKLTVIVGSTPSASQA